MTLPLSGRPHLPRRRGKVFAGPSIGLTPTGDGGQGTDGLTLVIKGPQGSMPYAGPDAATGEMSLQNGVA